MNEIEQRLADVEHQVHQRPWRAEIIAVAALVLAITTVGWFKVQGFSDDIRDAALKNCIRQNLVREALRDELDLADRITSQFTEVEYRRAIGLEQQRVLASRAAIRASLTVSECEHVFP